jgi:hypothetical protein
VIGNKSRQRIEWLVVNSRLVKLCWGKGKINLSFFSEEKGKWGEGEGEDKKMQGWRKKGFEGEGLWISNNFWSGHF